MSDGHLRATSKTLPATNAHEVFSTSKTEMSGLTWQAGYSEIVGRPSRFTDWEETSFETVGNGVGPTLNFKFGS